MTEDRDPEAPARPEVTIALTPQQLGGFVLIAALIVAILRRLRRRRS